MADELPGAQVLINVDPKAHGYVSTASKPALSTAPCFYAESVLTRAPPRRHCDLMNECSQHS